MATVYVGIVLYNSLDDLPNCFAGLRDQTYKPLTITVLDNASPDASLDWVEANVPEATVIRKPDNVGFARAHNAILAHRDLQPGDYYLPLNPDVTLTPTYVEHLLARMQSAGAGWGTGKLLLYDDQWAESPALYSAGHALRRDGYTMNIGYYLPDGPDFAVGREVFGAPGAACMISADLIADIAPDGELFDADMFMYGEDTDLDWRARRAGWRCWYVPDAVAYHRGSQPGESLRVQAVANRHLGTIKNAFLLDLLMFNLPLIVLHMLLRLVASPRVGREMASRIIRMGPRMWRKRCTPKITYAEMNRWFQWSRRQPTGQPTSLVGRLQSARRGGKRPTTTPAS